MDFLLVVTILSLLSFFPHLLFSQATTCKSTTFSNKKTFDNCMDLPALKAVLHWTYSNKTTLSIAFTAPPPTPDGWVAWALNPNGQGMIGAQALLAYKPKPTDPISLDTYDIKSYHDLVKGPISYNVTAMSAEESKSKITIFATWALPHGPSTVNHVWQVGPVLGGEPGKHEFEQANLGSKMKLDLVNGLAGAQAKSPVGSNGDNAGALATAPATNGAGDVLVAVKSLWLCLGALLVSLF